MKLSFFIFSVLVIAYSYFLTETECILYGEKVTNRNRFKYQVGIVAKRNSSYFSCGGGIINDYFILTAAHCFAPGLSRDIENHQMITVRANTLYNRISPKSAMVRRVVKVIVPTAFFRNRLADVAIIKLDKSLKLSGNSRKLQALRLPTPNNVVDDGQAAVVAGYGVHELIRDHEGNISFNSDGRLRTIDVNVFSHEKLQEPYGQGIYDDTFLAGVPIDSIPGYPRGFCSGDSGSPLVIGTGENIKVIGVVKINDDYCDDTGKPGIYVKVSSYFEFINIALGDPNGSTNFIRVKTFRSTTRSCLS